MQPVQGEMENIPLDQLLKFLEARPAPVAEPDLLKHFLPWSQHAMLSGVSLELYRAHFTLYHHLYRLSENLEGSERFLFIRLIYVYLLKKPASGFCKYFDRGASRFCSLKTLNGQKYCSRHEEEQEDHLRAGTLDASGIRSFYLDRKNYCTMDEDTLKSFSRGIYEYAARHEEVDRCLDIFDLSLDYSLERLKMRYRYLSKRHHPDMGNDRSISFADITHAYQVLLNLKS